MNLVLFLLLSGIVIYLFATFFPWDGFDKHSFPLPKKKAHARIPTTKKAQQKQLPAPRRELDLHNLNLGDVVMVDRKDYLVVEFRDVQEDDWTWRDYILEDVDEVAQLSVGEEGKEVFLLEPTFDIEISHPPPKKFRHQNKIYHMTSQGKATVKSTQLPFRYYTYEGPNGQVVVCEDWDDPLDVYVGESIDPNLLEFLPGSPDNL